MPEQRVELSNVTLERLRDKALLALEDAIQETRYRTPRRSFALRFALAFLWAYSGCRDRYPFEELWNALGRPFSAWSFSVANTQIRGIYRALGIERPDDIEASMWRRWSKEEGKGGG